MPIKKIKETIRGARETVGLMRATNKANKSSKQNIKSIGITLAKKNYKEKTGREMTLSTLRSEQAGGRLSKESREYLQDKKNITKAKMKHYGFKK